jgi:hypothetical protein
MSNELPAGHWLETLIAEDCDGSDFNDGEEVLGYLSGKLERKDTIDKSRWVPSWILTVAYVPDDGEDGPLHPAKTERYRVTLIKDIS